MKWSQDYFRGNFQSCRFFRETLLPAGPSFRDKKLILYFCRKSFQCAFPFPADLGRFSPVGPGPFWSFFLSHRSRGGSQLFLQSRSWHLDGPWSHQSSIPRKTVPFQYYWVEDRDISSHHYTCFSNFSGNGFASDHFEITLDIVGLSFVQYDLTNALALRQLF